MAARASLPDQIFQAEIQISLNNAFNQTVNALSISIAPQEIREIEAIAEPVRQSVKALYAAYRPLQGNGDQDVSGSVSENVQQKFAEYQPDSGAGKPERLG